MSVTIRPVTTKKEMKQFICFNYELYKGSPYAVPELYSDVRDTLDPKKNAAFEFCEAQPFIALRDENDNLLKDKIPEVLKRMKEMGVSTWAVIHCPEGGYGLDENNNYIEKESLHLPAGYIKGSVGAGDAFCAGVAIGLTYGKNLSEACKIGSRLAASVIVTSENVCPRFMPGELGLHVEE